MIERTFSPKLPEWLSEGGEDFDVIVASEAQYIRNLSDRPFPGRLTPEDLRKSRTQFKEGLSDIFKNYSFAESETLGERGLRFLAERLTASQESLEKKVGTGLFISPNEATVIALNSYDHFRIRVAYAGNNIEASYRAARHIEESLEETLPFAYSERYGFLTARPTECGTGLILRFYVHIPGIIFSNKIAQLREKLLKTGTVLRPLFDEAISSEGHIFIIDTSHSLGVDEEDLLASSMSIIEEILDMEVGSREDIISKARFQIEDKILRGIGVLTHARMIMKNEGYALANALRLGAAEELIQNGPDIIAATELFIVGQVQHLSAISGKGTKTVLDTNRAELFRSYLNNKDIQ